MPVVFEIQASNIEYNLAVLYAPLAAAIIKLAVYTSYDSQIYWK